MELTLFGFMIRYNGVGVHLKKTKSTKQRKWIQTSLKYGAERIRKKLCVCLYIFVLLQCLGKIVFVFYLVGYDGRYVVVCAFTDPYCFISSDVIVVSQITINVTII